MNFWHCQKTWKQSAKNTFVCLIGCAIGDNAVILGFQLYGSSSNILLIMVLAMLVGLLSSVSLESVILWRHFRFFKAVKIALGMSLISMLMMEAAANLASLVLAGGNRLALSFWSIIPAWFLGYISAWIYNYFQLRKHGKSCHG